MAKITITIIMAIMAQVAMAQEFIFKKYEDSKGVESVYISKALMSLASGKLNLGDIDLRSVSKKIDSIRILSCDNPTTAKNIKNDALTAYRKYNYEEIMKVSEDGEKTNIYYRTCKGKNELVLLNIDGKELQIINVIGSITLEDIKNLTK